MDENRAAFANTAPNERMTDAYWALSGITMFSGLAAAGKTARADTVRGLAGGNVRLHLFNRRQSRGPVNGVAAIQPHRGTITTDDQSIAIMLDFREPNRRRREGLKL